MVHRGPDDEGVYVDPDCALSLSAWRLSIIDVAGGHQPIGNEDGSVWAVLNGEIYNHAPLRERLRDRGHSFASHTDTEVLVHLYEEYGDSLVHAVEGMYAFAIWDRKARRLTLGRDRFGEKPLFYAELPDRLVFASELTALRAGLEREPEVDPESLDAFFVLGYVPCERNDLPGGEAVAAREHAALEHGGAQARGAAVLVDAVASAQPAGACLGSGPGGR